MSFFQRKKKYEYTPIQWKIKKKCLKIILESAKSIYPKEFGGLLRVDTNIKNTIIEVILLPGTISGGSQALFSLHMLPIDFSIVGTVHSHPSSSYRPSEADKMLFNKYGKIHVIIASPFSSTSWKAYDKKGEQMAMHII